MSSPYTLEETLNMMGRHNRGEELRELDENIVVRTLAGWGIKSGTSRAVFASSVLGAGLFLAEPEIMFKNGRLRSFAPLNPKDPDSTLAHPIVILPLVFVLVGGFT